ncbi:MAG: N-acetyltransferase family protein [Pseudomonadota bacterium]
MITHASTKDARWIARLWNDVIAHTQITFTTRRKSVAEIEKRIADRNVLTLQDKGGFATYGPFRDGPGYATTVEHTIILDPKVQGNGAGRALLSALERHAHAAGHHVTVAAISSANPGAVAFHTALGFAQVAHMRDVGRKDGVWLDLILMQKHLGGAVNANAREARKV